MTKLAVFDFDDTLIKGDSLLPFLRYAVGTQRLILALAWAAIAWIMALASGEMFETRTLLKKEILTRTLLGKKRDDVKAAAEKMRLWQKKNMSMVKALNEHRANGDTIVIASGALDLYLPEMLAGMPYDDLICTNVGVNDGILTGEMINGNCVRQCKAGRLEEWLQKNGPFEESFGYGNYPHDVPMLNLLKHRIIFS